MTNPLLAGLPPVHPGEILREDIIPALKISKAEVARLINVSRQTLYDVLNEKQGVTPALALKLGRLFGNSPQFWLNLQQAYDLKIVQGQIAEELEKIPLLEAA